jgi:YjjG family noncanonical pyrimidine nucleotidase
LYHHKKHLFFDLDHTLWHYEANCAAGLKIIFDQNLLQAEGIGSAEVLYQSFYKVNTALWRAYETGEITSAILRKRRFEEVLASFDLQNIQLAHSLSEQYMALIHTLPQLLPGALDLLHYLAPSYQLHILSNGFSDIQQKKLKHSGIIHFFKSITTSELALAVKPQPQIFRYALKVAKARVSDSLMIGDNPNADIAGAQNIGMDSVFYNPSEIILEQSVKTQIKHLLDLKHFL